MTNKLLLILNQLESNNLLRNQLKFSFYVRSRVFLHCCSELYNLSDTFFTIVRALRFFVNHCFIFYVTIPFPSKKLHKSHQFTAVLLFKIVPPIILTQIFSTFLHVSSYSVSENIKSIMGVCACVSIEINFFVKMCTQAIIGQTKKLGI